MSEDTKAENKTNWFLIVPTLGSLVWLGIITLFLYLKFQSIDAFLKQDFNALGDFFAGAFAPLATFWLVFAVLIQSRQLKLQREELVETRKTMEAQRVEMAESAKQAKAQAEAVQETSKHQSRDTFAQISRIIERDLLHYTTSILAQLTDGNVIRDVLNDQSFGNKFAVFNSLSNLLINSENSRKKLNDLHSKNRGQLVLKFKKSFENLLLETDHCDDEVRRLRQLYEDGSMGLAYALVMKSTGLESRLLIAEHNFEFKN